MLRGRVRRRLHRAAAVTRVEHVPEGALEVDGLRGRVAHRPPLASDPALDGAEQARPVSGRGEHRVEQEGGRGLPVRARDRSHGESRRRPAEEGVGGGCHRCARIAGRRAAAPRDRGDARRPAPRRPGRAPRGHSRGRPPRSRERRSRAFPALPHGCRRRGRGSPPRTRRREGMPRSPSQGQRGLSGARSRSSRVDRERSFCGTSVLRAAVGILGRLADGGVALSGVDTCCGGTLRRVCSSPRLSARAARNLPRRDDEKRVAAGSSGAA